MFEFYNAVCLRHARAPAHVFLRSIEDLEDPLRSRYGRLDLPVELGQFIDRPRELLRVDDESGDDTHSDGPLDDEVAAEHRHDHEGNVVQHIHHRAHGTRDDLCDDPGLRQLVRGFVKIFDRLLLLIVGGHGLIVRDFFLHDPVDRPEQLLALHVVFADQLRDHLREDDRENDRRAGKQRQLPAVPRHDGYGTYERQDPGEQGGERLRDHARNVFGVIGHPADQIPVRVAIQIRHRQVDRLTEQFPPDGSHYALGQVGRQDLLRHRAKAGPNIHGQHNKKYVRQLIKCLHCDAVNGPAQKAGCSNL